MNTKLVGVLKSFNFRGKPNELKIHQVSVRNGDWLYEHLKLLHELMLPIYTHTHKLIHLKSVTHHTLTPLNALHPSASLNRNKTKYNFSTINSSNFCALVFSASVLKCSLVRAGRFVFSRLNLLS